MSDFLFSTCRQEPGALARCLLAHLAPVAASCDEHHGTWGSLAVVRGHHDGAPAIDDDGFLSVLAGDPRLGFPGGGAPGARRALHGALRAGQAVARYDRLDGHFAVLGVEAESGRGVVVTDRFGFVPVFVSAIDGPGRPGLVLGTHVDAVARAAGRTRDVDPVSAADLAIHLTCTFPHTLYHGVAQVMPGTVRRFTARGWEDAGHACWRPVESTDLRSLGEAADALRTCFEQDVRAACEGMAEVGMLLSGGEDSRAVLGAVPAGVRVRSFTYADWESREVRIARSVARAYGSSLEVGWRTPDHYLARFPEVVAMIGSGHHCMDVHGYGFEESLGLRELPRVLGGLSSDSLLKAVYAPNEPGRPIRVPAAPLMREPLRRAVIERRTRFYDWLREIRPTSADEWIVLWPFSMRRHGGNVDGNRRLFRSHEVYHATAVLDVARAAPWEWKRHRRLFHLAMRPFFAKSWAVPHPELRFPYFGRGANLLLAPGLGLARGVRALAAGEIRRRHVPWPKWSKVAAQAMARQGREHPLLRSPLREIFDDAPPVEIERAVRGWHPRRQLMLLQLACLTAEGRQH